MQIIFASDHAGYALKGVLLSYVRDELGYEVEDVGAYTLDTEDDYNSFVSIAVKKVAGNPECTRAILLGGSGQGEAMQGNRLKGVRAAVLYGGEPELALAIARLSREHNDSNVLSIGARFISESLARDAVKLWLETEKNPEDKYARRIRVMDDDIKV